MSNWPTPYSPLDFIGEEVSLDSSHVAYSQLVTTELYPQKPLESTFYGMSSSMSSVRQTIDGQTIHYLAWASTLFTSGSLTTQNVVQQWFAPTWNPAATDGFANFICEFKSNTITTSIRLTDGNLYEQI